MVARKRSNKFEDKVSRRDNYYNAYGIRKEKNNAEKISDCEFVCVCVCLLACLLFLEQIKGGKQDQKFTTIVIRLLRLLNITKVECVLGGWDGMGNGKSSAYSF